MKIALVVPGFSAHEQDWCIPFLLDHVRMLAQWAEVHVFTLRWPERGGTYPVFGATVHALDGRKNLGARVLSLWARAVRAIAAEHRRAPFNVLHAVFADEPGWVAAWAARWLGVPLILSPMGGEFIGLPDIGYGFQLLRGRAQLTGWATRQAACITASSNYQGQLIRAAIQSSRVTVPVSPRAILAKRSPAWPEDYFGKHAPRNDIVLQPVEQLPSKIIRAPFGVDTKLFKTCQVSCEADLTGLNALRVLSVASLTPVKNHALLLRALAHVPNAHLQLAGSGPLEKGLRALAHQLNIADRVEFLGEVNHAALPAVYHSADVFVQTSRHEAQGLAVLEAAACGLPVLGTPVGLLPEVGEVAPGEAELIQKLIALRDDAAQRQALSQRAYERVQTDLALEVTGKRWRDLYHAL